MSQGYCLIFFFFFSFPWADATNPIQKQFFPLGEFCKRKREKSPNVMWNSHNISILANIERRFPYWNVNDYFHEYQSGEKKQKAGTVKCKLDISYVYFNALCRKKQCKGRRKSYICGIRLIIESNFISNCLEGNQSKNSSLVSNFYYKLKSPALFSQLFRTQTSAGNFNLLYKLLTRQFFLF